MFLSRTTSFGPSQRCFTLPVGACGWGRGVWPASPWGKDWGPLSQDSSPTQSPLELELPSEGLRPRLGPGSQDFREASGVTSWGRGSTRETPSAVPPTCSTEAFRLPNITSRRQTPESVIKLGKQCLRHSISHTNCPHSPRLPVYTLTCCVNFKSFLSFPLGFPGCSI